MPEDINMFTEKTVSTRHVKSICDLQKRKQITCVCLWITNLNKIRHKRYLPYDTKSCNIKR